MIDDHTSKAEQGWRHGHGQENARIHYQPDIIPMLAI
jgi:hypothetical protein